MDFQTIDRLVELSQQPLRNRYLENLPQRDAPERVNYYRLLYHLVRTLQPRLGLEIGVERGYGSAFMCEAAAGYGGYVIGVDVNDCPLPDLFERFDNYIFVRGDSTKPEVVETVGGYAQRHGMIGLVFQDSSHHYEASRQEWNLYTQLMGPGGVWLCDDISPAFHDPLIDPPGLGMVQYFEALPGRKKLYPNVLHRGNTQGVVLRD